MDGIGNVVVNTLVRMFSALASMLGGLFGGRGPDPIGRPTDTDAER
jgi:hypothetical protein